MSEADEAVEEDKAHSHRAIDPSTVAAHVPSLLVFSLVYFIIFIGETFWRVSFPVHAANTFSIVEPSGYYALIGLAGLLAVGIGWLATQVRIHILLLLSCVSMGMGMIIGGLTTNAVVLAVMFFAVYLGFSSFYPVVNSLCLIDSGRTPTPVALGRLKSVGPLAALLVTGVLIYLVDSLPVGSLLALIGALVLGFGAVMAYLVKRKSYAHIPWEMRFESHLWPYYSLNFLAGCRSGIFMATVPFYLMTQHGVLLKENALLSSAGYLASYLGYFAIGLLVHRFSHRRVLTLIYSVVAVIFLGFALFSGDAYDRQPWVLPVLLGLYLLDSAVFGASVVTESYLKKGSQARDFVGDVATGLSLFSLGRMLAPIAGLAAADLTGGIEGKFLLGSLFALIALLVGRRLR